MKRFSVLVEWRAGYFGGKQYIIEAETRAQAIQQGVERAKQYILKNDNIPDWVANSATLKGYASEIK